MSSDATVTVGSLVGMLEKEFDPAWAEAWDRVGLICGDPSAGVRGVLVTRRRHGRGGRACRRAWRERRRDAPSAVPGGA